MRSLVSLTLPLRLIVVAAFVGALLDAHPGAAPDALQGRRTSPQTSASKNSNPGKVHTITIESMSFQPQTLTIKAGDSIVWINKDPFPHTATSKEGGFDSGEIATEKSWKLTPQRSQRGEFPYACTLHPTMKGVLRVE
jgi:plastocyanin